MASLLYKTQLTTRLHDIDAAGVVFFARAFYHAHDAYEAFLNHHQYSIASILESDCIIPITHTEADFIAPVFLNEKLTIEIYSQEINSSDFSLGFHFVDTSQKIRIKLITRHVCLKQKPRERTEIPETLLKIISTS